MDFTFIRASSSEGLPAWDVLVDNVVIGRVERRDQIGRNLTRSYVYSGPGRRVSLWEGTVWNAGLPKNDAQAVQQYITRPKTSRRTAALHMYEAYAAAGVDLPGPGVAEAA